MKLITSQTTEMEYCMSEHHRLHRGLTPDEAQNNYLEHAIRIPFYGVYFFKSKDSMDKDIKIGVTTVGTIVYQNDHIVNEFSWSKMIKISFKRRTFFMELKRELVSFCLLQSSFYTHNQCSFTFFKMSNLCQTVGKL